jgi:hypothetical protein
LFLNNYVDASIILAIVILNGLLSFWQEHSASNAVKNFFPLSRSKLQ